MDSESSDSECDELLKKFVIPKSEEIEKIIFKDRSRPSISKIIDNDDQQINGPITNYIVGKPVPKPIFVTPDHKQLFYIPEEENFKYISSEVIEDSSDFDQTQDFHQYIMQEKSI